MYVPMNVAPHYKGKTTVNIQRQKHKGSRKIEFTSLCRQGFPGGTSGKEAACQFRRLKDAGSPGWEDPLEKDMATPSIALRITLREEPGGLQSLGSYSRTRLKQLSTQSLPITNHRNAVTKDSGGLVYIIKRIYMFQALSSKTPAFSMPMRQLQRVALPDIKNPVTYRGVGRWGEGWHWGASFRWRHPPGLKKWGKAVLRQV